MSADLRSYLKVLESKRPGDLIRISMQVSSHQEPFALVRALEAEGRHPALWFDRVDECTIPVLINLHATAERLALALDAKPEALGAEYKKRLGDRLKPVVVSEGPVQEVCFEQEDVDLDRLPLMIPFAQTPQPYLSGSIVVACDPDSGCPNLSFNRIMKIDKRHATFHPAPGLHLYEIMRKYELRQEPCPIAVILGYHPAFALGTLAKVPFDVDEYACASAMLRRPVELVKARTVPLSVPAHAEIVLEGWAFPNRLGPEGPYGEFTGYALPEEQKPMIEFTAITHRKDPLYQDVVPGCREHLFLGKVPKEASLEQRLKSKFACIQKVHMPLSGCGRFHMIIAVKEHAPEEIRGIMLAAFGMDHFLKHVYVVDDDVDVTQDREIFWAKSTAFQGDKDMLVLERMPGTDLDPSAESGGIGAKVGFDCTRKGSAFPPRHSIDEDVMGRVQRLLS